MLDDVVGAPSHEGWEAWDLNDAFERTNAVVYRATGFTPEEGELVRIGVRVTERNCNFFGNCHGGFLAAMLDIAMGRNALAAVDPNPAPTISMTVDFVRAAAPGDWLESRARVVRRTRRVVFCEGALVGAKGIVARSSGVFAVMEPQA